MSELLSQGQPVKLDGLGTFSPAVEGQGNGKNDMETAVSVGPDAMINGIKINFVPENTKGEKLTSRAFKEQCIFEYGYVVQSEIRTVNGKQRRVQKKTPGSCDPTVASGKAERRPPLAPPNLGGETDTQIAERR